MHFVWRSRRVLEQVSRVINDKAIPKNGQENSGEMPKRMSIDRPGNRWKIRQLESDEHRRQEHGHCTSPHVQSTFGEIHKAPAEPTDHIDQTDDDVHCHVVAKIHAHEEQIVRVVEKEVQQRDGGERGESFVSRSVANA